MGWVAGCWEFFLLRGVVLRGEGRGLEGRGVCFLGCGAVGR